MANDPYQELGVSRGASADEIRKSFRKLAKKLHPDQNPGDKAAEERFKRVAAAFDLLGDEEKKAKFDRGEIDADGRETMRGFDPRGGSGGFNGFAGFGAGRGGGQQGAGFSGRSEGAEFEDVLGEFFARQQGGGGGPGGGGFGRGFAARGQDVRSQLEIDVSEAILGAQRRVVFPDGRQLDLTIPKNSHDGQVLRLKGQGSPGRGGAAGDALIELKVQPGSLYRIDGADLHMDLPISLPDAVLGARVQAPTPDGEVALKVAANSSSGSVLRLKGRGAVEGQSGRRGDLYARLMIVLPEGPDVELERLAETMRRDRPYAPRRR